MKVLSKKVTKTVFLSISILALIISIVMLGVVFFREEKRTILLTAEEMELAVTRNYEQFEEGDEAISGTENVKFSAFFLRDLDGDGYAEKIKGTCRKISETDTLYMEVIVQSEGYLKDGKIQIEGKNMCFHAVIPKDEEIKENYVGGNIKEIEFNDLNNGTQKILTGFVRSGDNSFVSFVRNALNNNINNYSRDDNKIIFTGIYVNEDGTEQEIRKEIELATDWYGEVTARIGTINDS
jgi:hypothetical protein